MSQEGPRNPFPHGTDCTVSFVRRADNDRALVDVWSIEANNKKYHFHMMIMRTSSSGSWVFGSFYDAETGDELWRFRDDVRTRRGFRGGTLTFAHNDCTYVIFESANTPKFVFHFVDFLANPNLEREVIGPERIRMLSAYLTPAVVTSAVQETVPEPAATKENDGVAVDAPVVQQSVLQEWLKKAQQKKKPLHTRSFSAKDPEHEWFFKNVLVQMCVKQPE